MFKLLICTACLVGATALTEASLRGQAGGFIHALAFKHRLRVCNAYPNDAALDVVRGKSDKFTDDAPMKYGTCRDFVSPLKSGDKIEFKVGAAITGTFSVGDLPQNDAVLLLVINRHDTRSTAVSFESHVFANLHNAEVVVMDAYKGAQHAFVTIKDAAKASSSEASKKKIRSEELRYDSVVAIDAGEYEVALMGYDGKAQTKKKFKAAEGETYVIIRTGLEAQEGKAYPQELLIYPYTAAAFSKASMGLFALFFAFAQWL